MDKSWNRLPIHVFLLSVFLMLVPSLLLYGGSQFIEEPWILILVIHWVVMIAIPFF